MSNLNPTQERWKRFFPIFLVALGLICYANSFRAVFVFDDLHWIQNNPYLRQWWPSAEILEHTARPLVHFSLAVNYALGGLNVWGYHAFNLGVHLAAALALYGLTRRTLQGTILRLRYGDHAEGLAFCTAAIWLAHPLQTESVTYVIQRAESLMGLFYLLTLYCFVRGIESPRGDRWRMAAVICCGLGMASKPVMVTAPLAVILYDRVFVAQSLREAMQQRWRFYLGLAATWGIAIFLLSASSDWRKSVGMVSQDISPLNYGWTQFSVILHYLRLSVWPQPLVFDYDDWPIAKTFATAIMPAIGVAALVLLTLWNLRHRPALGFVGVFFFLILAPTSSFLPIVTEIAAEHRMYLPLASVVILGVIGMHRLIRATGERLLWSTSRVRWMERSLAVAIIFSLGWQTIQRNEDYHSEIALWSDTVAKRPHNHRALAGLGVALIKQGQLEDAKPYLLKALEINPRHAEARTGLGLCAMKHGQLTEAIRYFEETLRYNPDYVQAHINLGLAYGKLEQFDQAEAHFTEALRLNPQQLEAHFNLGLVLAKQRKFAEAERYFSNALNLVPNDVLTLYHLAIVLAEQNKREAAILRFQQALVLARQMGHSDLVHDIQQRMEFIHLNRTNPQP